LREPHKELDTVADIKKKRSLERKGHLARMHLGRVVKKIHESKPGGRMARPRLRWMEAAEEGIRGMKVKSWRHKTVDKEERTSATKEAMALRGP
jgi:hypothetical protein